MTTPSLSTHRRVLGGLIFGSRWLQVPLYLGLIVAQAVYVFLFLKELTHLLSHAQSFNEQQIMLIVLALIDVVMISNCSSWSSSAAMKRSCPACIWTVTPISRNG